MNLPGHVAGKTSADKTAAHPLHIHKENNISYCTQQCIQTQLNACLRFQPFSIMFETMPGLI